MDCLMVTVYGSILTAQYMGPETDDVIDRLLLVMICATLSLLLSFCNQILFVPVLILATACIWIFLPQQELAWICFYLCVGLSIGGVLGYIVTRSTHPLGGHK